MRNETIAPARPRTRGRRLAALGIAIAAAAGGAALVPHDASSETGQLSGDVLRQVVPGATVHLDTPIGTVVPITHGEDGTLAGKAGAVAWFLGASTDRGRWWVKGDKLCHRWTVWFKGEQRCFELSRDGEKLAWKRDDGETGTAKLVEAPRAVAAAEPVPLPPARALGGPSGAPVPQVAPTPAPITAATVARPAQAPPLVAATTMPPAPAAKAAPKVQGVLHRPTAPGMTGTRTAAVTAQPPPPAPVAAAPAPQTSPQTSPQAPTLPPQAATQPPPAAPAAPASAIAYRVVRVAADDVLNIRVGPSDTTAIVATLAPGTPGVRMVGQCVGFWCPIAQGGRTGWVNRYYLELMPFGPDRTAARR